MQTQTWLSCHYKFISPENYYSLSRQMTFYMLFSKLENNKCEITVHSLVKYNFFILILFFSGGLLINKM